MHLGWPLLLSAVALGLLMGGGGDLWLADRLYAWQGGQWLWRDHWLASAVLHRGGRMVSQLAWIALLVAAIACWSRAGERTRCVRMRRVLLYLVLSGLLASTLIALLKQLTNVDCPWNLLRYGGSLEFVGLFQPRPPEMPRGVCFPAGHAGAGYAWVCLYFAALMWRPSWRWVGLAIGLLAGLLFGVTQQLRGAHFLSHDLCSLLLCWLVALCVWWVMDGRTPRRGRPDAGAGQDRPSIPPPE